MKNDFYKTFDEHILAKIVSGFYNDIIGEDENTFLDEGKDKCNHFESAEEIAPLVLDLVMKGFGGYVTAEYKDEIYALEAKHLRFMGKKRIEEIVNHRVEFMFKKFPPVYPENN